MNGFTFSVDLENTWKALVFLSVTMYLCCSYVWNRFIWVTSFLNSSHNSAFVFVFDGKGKGQKKIRFPLIRLDILVYGALRDNITCNYFYDSGTGLCLSEPNMEPYGTSLPEILFWWWYGFRVIRTRHDALQGNITCNSFSDGGMGSGSSEPDMEPCGTSLPVILFLMVVWVQVHQNQTWSPAGHHYL